MIAVKVADQYLQRFALIFYLQALSETDSTSLRVEIRYYLMELIIFILNAALEN